MVDLKSTTGDLPSLAIRRPVLVLVANLLIVIAGLAALGAVEIRELPNVDRPVVSVRAEFPGASPETMDAEVTRILEGAVARVSGLYRLRSASEENSARIFAEFNPGVDLDAAAAEVREAVSRVSRQLPDRVENVFVVKADQDAQPVITVAATSETLSDDALARVVEQDVIPELISIDGVADVTVSGSRRRQLRVVVDPLRLTSFNLSMNDVEAVLREAPFDVPAGSLRSDVQELLVRANASVTTAQQVRELMLTPQVRLDDVANVYFGPADASQYSRLNGLSVIGLGVIRQAGSNTISIAEAVRSRSAQLERQFKDLSLAVTDDSSTFIVKSIRELLISMALTVSIVISTIWIFLGSARATLVPAVTIPVALIGTLAAIWLGGFSVNNLTLLALLLATGLVVDDAIVVLENIQRKASQGMGARAAAVIGTRQVYFAVIATSAVLISVFIPIAFLPGTAGGLFREFGFVLAVAVAISSFVALSLVPAMASRLASTRSASPDSADNSKKRGGLLLSVGSLLKTFYLGTLSAALARPLLALLLALGTAAGAAALYPLLDKELLPNEDRGLVRVRASGPDGVGLGYIEGQTQLIERILEPYRESGEVTDIFTVVGTWDPHRSGVTLPLADWSRRERSQGEIIRELRRKLDNLPGARVSVYGDNSLNLRGQGGGLEFAVTGSDYEEIFEGAKLLAAAITEQSTLVRNPDIGFAPTQPQLAIQIDRQRASELGVELNGLASTLTAAIDGVEVVDLNIDDEAVPLLLEASINQINDPTDLMSLHVSTGDGQLVPLTSLVTVTETGVATQLDRHGQRRAIEVDVDLAAGVPLADAVADIERLAAQALPAGLNLMFRGEAATLEESTRGVAVIYGVALLVVFLVLCAQFEGFMSATVVTLTVPLGVAAALAALFLTGTSINIYSQVGLILLIGLMAKNGILVVEFADQLRDRGMAVKEAITLSAEVRMRPVAMTIVSTVLGALPLILASGAGAEARAAIGWVIFGGLGFAALFTLYVTPVIYLLLGRFGRVRSEEVRKLETEIAQAQQAR
ncbi:MAG: efflux RND transporter permease subunit [Pseudomonadota bacterium]